MYPLAVSVKKPFCSEIIFHLPSGNIFIYIIAVYQRCRCVGNMISSVSVYVFERVRKDEVTYYTDHYAEYQKRYDYYADNSCSNTVLVLLNYFHKILRRIASSQSETCFAPYA